MTRKSNNTCLQSISDNLNSGLLDNRLSKTITFAAATTGAVGATDLCTVTGVVALSIFAVCETTLTISAGATIEVGTAASTAGLIAQTAGDAIDENEIWHDASPDTSLELTSVISKKIVSDDVIQTIASDTITGGKITYYISWSPISPNGNVVIA